MRFRRSTAFLLAMSRLVRSSFLAALLALTAARADAAVEAYVPFGGNAYLTTEGAGDGLQRDGSTRWQDAKSVFSIYFRIDRAAVLDLALRLKVPQGESVIRTTVGKTTFETKANWTERQAFSQAPKRFMH